MTEAKLILSRVDKGFKYRSSATVVLESFSLEVKPKEIISLVGPSGCGKTTILNLIAGFIEPDAGQIFVNGQSISGPDRTRAVIFQEDAVFPWYSTAQNIEYGLKVGRVTAQERKTNVERLLSEFDLLDERDKYPSELSGGQRKRVDMARAFANRPEIILMDEPFGSLDPITKENLQTYASKVLDQREITTLLVTHDLEEAIWLSDRVILLTRRPARIKSEYSVPFKRPRKLELRFSTEFQELRRELSHEFQKEKPTQA